MGKLDVVPKEDYEQIRLSNWLHKMGIVHTASGNGGKRTMLAALKLQRMGLSPGFPDIEIPLPIPNGYGLYKYCGLYIEMKRTKGGKVTEQQKEWIRYLNNKGYKAYVAKGFEEAKAIVLEYLSLMPRAA